MGETTKGTSSENGRPPEQNKPPYLYLDENMEGVDVEARVEMYNIMVDNRERLSKLELFWFVGSF